MKSRKNKNYTFEFKISVVELYLTTEISYQELALKVGMNNPRLITKWVDDFRIAGHDAIRSKSKGREAKTSTHKEANKTEESTDYLKRLEEALNKKQELSVTSEDYSD